MLRANGSGLRSGAAAGGSPLEVLRRGLPPAPMDVPPDLPFVGGAVGLFGYGLGASLLPVPGSTDPDEPDFDFALVDRFLLHDHSSDRTRAIALGFGASLPEAHRAAESSLEQLVDGPSAARSTRRAPPRAHRLQLGLDREAHGKAVERIQDHIRAGDLYQACLTHALELEFDGDPLDLYLRMRSANPAPFGAYLCQGGTRVLSTSPERFLHATPDRWLETRPIKGTRPRDPDPDRDAALARELVASEKERAENVMIVDLSRNDLGRVCETGSVHVSELYAVESYATVHQLVSTVRGRLLPGLDLLDAVASCFPPGSMTGAPKIAAMRLLHRIESGPRGGYAGALGFLDARGGGSLSVLIRAAFHRAGSLRIHTGGGIVADSLPDAEWHETWDKVGSLLACAGWEERESR